MKRRHHLLLLGTGAWLGPGTAAAAALAAGESPTWPAAIELVDGRRWAAPAPPAASAVVVFWATWCGFCRRHNARLERLWRAQPSLKLLGAAVDGDAASVRAHAAAQGWSFPITAEGAALRERWGLRRVVPLTLLIGADGRLLQTVAGELGDDDVAALPAWLQRAAPAR